MTNYYPISPARRRAQLGHIRQTVTGAWMVLAARAFCIAALGGVVLFTPELGAQRHSVGWLVMLGFAPAAVLMDLLVKPDHRTFTQTLFDLAALAICSYLLPGVWHPALLIGAVVLGKSVPGYALGAGFPYLLMPLAFGSAMAWIAWSWNIAGSYLPLLATLVVIPILLLYAVLERHRAQALANRSRVFEGLSQLAGSVGRDFNDILMTIQGNAELAAQNLERPGRSRKYLEALNVASHRATVLSGQLLAFSGDIPSGREHLNVREEILGLLSVLRLLVPTTIELKPDIAHGLPLVDADRAQLQQIIVNLVTYAAKAAGNSKLTLAITARSARFRSGEHLLIQVPIQDECSLTELFSEQTSSGGQRGIGVQRVLRFVEAHSGAIELYPTPQGGAMATLKLPVVANTSAPVIANYVPSAVPPQRICLLGEASALQEVTRSLLEALGHEVYSSVEPANVTAGDICERGDFDLLMADARFFSRHGWELLDRFNSHLPVLINSDREYAELPEPLNRRGAATELLTTPFSSAQLCAAIERSLRKAPAG